MKHYFYAIGYLGVLSGLAMLTSNSYADTDEAEQIVSVSVPKTLRIDIEDTNTSITYKAPTEAGKSFSSTTKSGHKDIHVALTSNVSTAKLYAKATVNGQPLSTFNLRLSIEGDGGILDQSVDLTENDQIFANIGNHVSGVLTETSEMLRVSGGLANSTDMLPYGTYNAIITYTLKEN
jgi:hypothetical protein